MMFVKQIMMEFLRWWCTIDRSPLEGRGKAVVRHDNDPDHDEGDGNDHDEDDEEVDDDHPPPPPSSELFRKFICFCRVILPL